MKYTEQNDVVIRILALEKEVRKLYALIEFWKGKVPLKYRKAFCVNDEDAYFTHKPFGLKTPLFHNLSMSGLCSIPVELEIPTDPKELEAAKSRMELRYKENKKYFDESQSIIEKNLTMDEERKAKQRAYRSKIKKIKRVV